MFLFGIADKKAEATASGGHVTICLSDKTDVVVDALMSDVITDIGTPLCLSACVTNPES